MALTEAHARAAAVFVDEFDASSLESLPQNDRVVRDRPRSRSLLSFNLSNSHDADARLISEILAGSNQGARGRLGTVQAVNMEQNDYVRKFYQYLSKKIDKSYKCLL